jgi:hypothetical protein
MLRITPSFIEDVGMASLDRICSSTQYRLLPTLYIDLDEGNVIQLVGVESAEFNPTSL